MIKKYFPGGNTGFGFYNCFEHIKCYDEEEYNTIILKGGPGVGKSTLMKNVANEAIKMGYDVSHFFCSGDPKSYDAIKIRETKTIIVDGTAPHIIDPEYPGVLDEIVNLGVYISPEIKARKEELMMYFAKNRYEYTRCYGYLNTAMTLDASNKKAYMYAFDEKLIDSAIRKHIKPDISVSKPRRKMFIDGITCDGYVSFKETIKGENVILVSGRMASYFMDRVNYLASAYSAELFLDLLNPENIKHIYIPELDMWFTTANISCDTVYEDRDFKKDEISDYTFFNEAECEILVANAIRHLVSCKLAHDEIENIYKEYVDFKGIDKEHRNLIDRVL